jgi:2-iminobutanoate/2-iminopropanoate deaminase
MSRITVRTENAPAAIGPYAQAVAVGPFLFTSGQIALDPRTMQVVDGGVAEQTERVLQNLAAVLEAAGCGLKDVVKTTVFLKDMNDFQTMNEVYGRHFGDQPPARSTVEVARLPKDVRVEIEVVAHRGA